ncbi:hypothetical protein QWJ34_12175 [Saccharibacillus sp. CPCC 101409]|uniref:hypothetical protein n=1 Tax=Saccharibacillus sp. CPCC 101409 TaxID=3058041 RepID=UPI002673E466|nr:hypothetical protein [Saccharibacillus sp. CPCC 101409]MDO3410519.1 hypothetical protein [Saccharibacillus sp. CPCC 101409]
MEDRIQRILDFLFVGAAVEGIRFGAGPQLLLSDSYEAAGRISGQIYINLSSGWRVFDTMPGSFPESEPERFHTSREEEWLALIGLRYKVIERAFISTGPTGLVLVFEDGNVFYMYGGDPKYESWTAGVAYSPPGEHWELICMPGGEIHEMAPDWYKEWRD